MSVMPSDHIITPESAFCESLREGADLIEERRDAILTFGIRPSFPATGYGYIKRGAALAGSGKGSFFEVESFREKPDRETAERFLEEGGYYWNAGIFLWRADTILEKIERFLPELHAGLMRIEPAVDTDAFDDTVAEIYPTLQKISIDYGVMEKVEERIVAAVDYRWDDVGSWRALERLLAPDGEGNHVQGACRSLGARDNVVSARGGMVGLIGVEGLVVVHTPDATLVCRKEDAEEVKKLVDLLEQEYR
jgi:mannose-1-phosphate guanylyltransferase